MNDKLKNFLCKLLKIFQKTIFPLRFEEEHCNFEEEEEQEEQEEEQEQEEGEQEQEEQETCF